MTETITVDLSNYKDRRGSRVPVGRYKVRITDVDTSTASSGNQMINVIFEIIEGRFSGNTLVDRYVQKETVLFRTVGLLQAIGVPTPRKRIAFRPNQLEGRVLWVDVDDGEPYQGVVRSEVRGWARVEAEEQIEEPVAEEVFAEASEPVADPWAVPPTETTDDDSDDQIDLDDIDLS